MTDVQQVESSRKPTRKRALKESVAPPPAIDPQTGKLNYDAAVAEAKQIIATGEKNHWRLAELAAQVETTYKKETLKKFAKDIGVAYCTAERLRSVWRAWADFPGAPPKFYSVAQALQDHPDRDKIIARNPDINTREARKLARAHKQKQDPEKDKQKAPDSRRKHIEKWFNDLVERWRQAIQDGEAAAGYLDSERRQILREVVEHTLLDTGRQAVEAWLKLIGDLKQVLDDPA